MESALQTEFIAVRSRLRPSNTRPVEKASMIMTGRPGSPGWHRLLRSWLENHRARRRLGACAALDPRFAADIGLTPDELAIECRALFWTPLPRHRR